MNKKYGIINILIIIQSKYRLIKLTGINQVNWDQLFQNKNVKEQVTLLNDIIYIFNLFYLFSVFLRLTINENVVVLENIAIQYIEY